MIFDQQKSVLNGNLKAMSELLSKFFPFALVCLILPLALPVISYGFGLIPAMIVDLILLLMLQKQISSAMDDLDLLRNSLNLPVWLNDCVDPNNQVD